MYVKENEANKKKEEMNEFKALKWHKIKIMCAANENKKTKLFPNRIKSKRETKTEKIKK